MHHVRMGVALVSLIGIAACASSPTVQTAGGDVATPSATPVNARTLPAGATMNLALDQQLGTESSHVGDTFSATTIDPVIAQNGRTTVPAGAKVWGHVSGVTRANNATETAALVLDFDSLTFNGRRYPFEANITATNLQKQGGSSTNETLKNAAIGAAAGAVLGAVLTGADRDKILLGAGVGAVAGTAISLGKGGENGVLPAGSRLSVQTTQSVALRY
jgi:YmgG-like glycine-zipper protein